MASMRICRKLSGCHQMPERSFFIGAYQFPLCARCTGIVIGHVVSISVSLFQQIPVISLLAVIPLMIDGMIQRYTEYESDNLRRLITGILYGFGAMSFFIAFVRRII